jgi:hypothetical protein
LVLYFFREALKSVIDGNILLENQFNPLRNEPTSAQVVMSKKLSSMKFSTNFFVAFFQRLMVDLFQVKAPEEKVTNSMTYP